MKLLKTATQAQRAIASNKKDRSFLAGTYRIHRKLKAAGLDSVSPEELLSEAQKSQYLSNVNLVINALEAELKDHAIDDALASVLKANLTRQFFAYAGVAMTMRNQPDGDLPKLVSELAQGLAAIVQSNQRLKPRLNNYSTPLFPITDDLILDFRSSSGKTKGSKSAPIVLSAREDKLAGFGNWLTNSYRGLIGQRERYRIDIGKEKPSNSKASFITPIASLNSANVDFYRHREALSAFLDGQQNLPSSALFNHVGDAATAGYMASLQQHGISTRLASHGCMIVHGTENRRSVSSALANSIYNSFPGVQELEPRSPLQLEGAWASKNVSSTRRLKPIEKTRNDKPFTILYAPNFLPWHQCYHGLVPSCFETRKIAEGLVQAFSKLDFPARLNIRIKTTVKDIARPDDANENRGLLPDDLVDLYDPDNQIHDASLGSHSSLLEDADLVISEGVTAVLFEALEFRKPLLLLNQSPEREPAIPSIRYPELMQSRKRNAVYASGMDDTLVELIRDICRLHAGQPLTDEELSPFVWI